MQFAAEHDNIDKGIPSCVCQKLLPSLASPALNHPVLHSWLCDDMCPPAAGQASFVHVCTGAVVPLRCPDMWVCGCGWCAPSTPGACFFG